MDGFVHVKSLTCRLPPRGGEKRGGKVGMLTSFIVRACDGRLPRAVTVTVTAAVVLSFGLDLTN